MLRRSKGVIRLLLAAVLLLVFCGILGFGLLLLEDYPDVIQTFGPPASDLDPLQRVALSLYLFSNASHIDLPAGDLTRTIELEVEEGQPAAAILAKLTSSGVVDNPTLFRAYLTYRGIDRQIETGRYLLSGSMTLREIAQALQSALPSGLALTVREGWRWEQIAEELDGLQTTASGEAFGEWMTRVPPGRIFSELIPPGATMEGFLFPDTYLVEPETTPDQILQQALDNFESKLTPSLLEGYNNQGLNLYQAVTLASIIEREAVIPDEQTLIASVFLNRIALGMKLDADPTIQYALARQPDGSWWKARLTLEDLSFDSPYNTYLYDGLPPGPIANPGLGALEAVAFPEATPYLYFRAACDGSGRHLFSVTFEEHVANACR